MSSSNLDLNVINYQDNLRSKPVRENFTDIENEFNAFRAEVYASIASTASEVTSARDNFTALTNNIHERKLYGNRVDGTGAYAVSISNLTVTISAGSGLVNGVGVYHASSATASVTVPSASNSRYDIVVLNTDNTRTIVTGTETTGTAVIPTSAVTQMPVARWHIFDTTSTLAPTDLRYKGIDPFQDEEYMDAHFTYSGDTLSTFGLTDVRDDERIYALGYSGDTLSTIGVTIDTKRYLTTFTYSGETLTDVQLSMS